MNLGVFALITVSLYGCDLDFVDCCRDCTRDDDDEDRLGQSRYRYTPFLEEEEIASSNPDRLRADLEYMNQKLLSAMATEEREKRQREARVSVFEDSPMTTEEEVTPRESPAGLPRKSSDPIPMMKSPLFEEDYNELKRLRLARRFSPSSFDAEQYIRSAHMDLVLSRLLTSTGTPATIDETSTGTDEEEEDFVTKAVDTAEDELFFGDVEFDDPSVVSFK
jgi:hypothetical protein